LRVNLIELSLASVYLLLVLGWIEIAPLRVKFTVKLSHFFISTCSTRHGSSVEVDGHGGGHSNGGGSERFHDS
jgi:hypothetical protein